jgi:hypothetical protein
MHADRCTIFNWDVEKNYQMREPGPYFLGCEFHTASCPIIASCLKMCGGGGGGGVRGSNPLLKRLLAKRTTKAEEEGWRVRNCRNNKGTEGGRERGKERGFCDGSVAAATWERETPPKPDNLIIRACLLS